MRHLRFYWNVLKKAISEFIEDDIFTHAAALSYYTIFSLPPILLIILSTTKMFYNVANVKAALFSQIEEMVGQEGTQLLIDSIDNIHVFKPTIWATILSISILIFTSTTVLVTMQNALNKIFKVKPKIEDFGPFKMLKDRALSFGLLISFAFILLISLVVGTQITMWESYLEKWLIGESATLTLLTSNVLFFIIIAVQIAMIFKFLPEAEIKWKDTWFGAFLTSILFGLGNYLISFYIDKSNVAGLYDAAGSIMVIMVWVFYTSVIIFFGAVFTYTRLKMLGGYYSIEKE